jgi:hypothetical protein
MERAGIDIITDGEIRRESYSNRFATALSGIDLDHPAAVPGRTGGSVTVPRIVGPIRRLRPVEVRDVEFLRRNTDRTIKITLPGPFTMSRQAKNEYYKDEEELVIDYAAAVNAELRDLKAAGADVIQLDEPWVQARPEEARRLALPAIDRALEGISGPTALRLCRPQQAERLFVPARTDRHGRRADLDRGGATQPRSCDPRRPRRQDRHFRRHWHGRPAARNCRNRRRPDPPRARAHPAGAADPSPRLRYEIHSARYRLRQIEGARRRRRDCATRAGRELEMRTASWYPA